jgi:hypothetical protein
MLEHLPAPWMAGAIMAVLLACARSRARAQATTRAFPFREDRRSSTNWAAGLHQKPHRR